MQWTHPNLSAVLKVKKRGLCLLLRCKLTTMRPKIPFTHTEKSYFNNFVLQIVGCIIHCVLYTNCWIKKTYCVMSNWMSECIYLHMIVFIHKWVNQLSKNPPYSVYLKSLRDNSIIAYERPNLMKLKWKSYRQGFFLSD